MNIESEQISSKSADKSRHKEISTSIKGMLRSQKAGKSGIYVRVTINRQHEYYPTNYYVKANDFDIVSGFVTSKNEGNKDSINSYIRYLVKELDEILTTLKKSGELVSIDNFKKFYLKRFKRDLNFESFFNSAMEEKKASIEPSTQEVYGRMLTKINEFESGVSVRAIDKTFIKKWEQWLLSEKKLCQNTANHYLETLRTFLIRAEDDGVITDNPFNKIKIRQVIGERDYLTQEELDALVRLVIPEANTGERRAREMFTFCCLTGIRYSDLIQLKWSHIRSLTNDMYFEMHKTKIFVTIPIIQEAKQILERQDKNSAFVFKKITNQKFNEHLHALERKAGIQKNITVHVARHTFATLALEKGVALEVVSKILGHKSLKTTMIYAKVTQKRLQVEMQKLNGLITSIANNAEVAKPDMKTLLMQMQQIMKSMENFQAAA
jgi:site-specific recombinase XerD